MKLQTIRSERLQEEYLYGKHETGLEILLAPMPGFQSVYAQFGAKVGSIDTAFKTDLSADYTEVPAGIAHYLEHKLFESEDGDAFSLFAKTGASANAFTSFDRTCYLFSATQQVEESLRALLTFVQHPYFTKETVQKEQGIIGQEIQMYEDDPDWCVFCNLLEALYHEHPVRVNIAGTVESISHITADLLYECYHTYYNLNNMVLVVAGNFDPDAVMQVVEECLVKKDPVTVYPKPFEEPQTVCRDRVTQTMSVSAPMFALGYKEAPLEGRKLLQAQLEYEVLLDVLTGESSSLYRELYNGGWINQTFGYEVFSGRGYLSVLFSGEAKQPEEVRRKLQQALDEAKETGITQEDFDRSRKALYGRLLRGLTRVEGVANSLMSAQMSGISMYDSFDILSTLTLEGVCARLRGSFDAARSALSVIEPAKSTDTAPKEQEG